MEKANDIIRSVKNINFENINQLREVVNRLDDKIQTLCWLLDPTNIDKKFVNQVQLIMERRILNHIKQILEFNINNLNID